MGFELLGPGVNLHKWCVLSLLVKFSGEIEILEHMKTLKRDGDESKQENKPSATKVQVLMPEISFWQL